MDKKYLESMITFYREEAYFLDKRCHKILNRISKKDKKEENCYHEFESLGKLKELLVWLDQQKEIFEKELEKIQ